MVREIVKGIGAVPRAFALLRVTPRLQRLTVIPAIISSLLLVVFVFLCLRYGGTLIDHYWSFRGDSGWEEALLRGAHFVLRVLITLFLLVIVGAIFFFCSALLAEPVLEPLSRATEQALGVEIGREKFSLIEGLRDLALTLRDVCGDLMLFGLVQLALLLLGMFPGAGHFLHGVLGWVMNAFFAGVEMSGEALARRGVRGQQRWTIFTRNYWRILGLGMGVMLLLLVPLLQLVTVPVAVIGGTIVVVDLEREGRLTDPARAS